MGRRPGRARATDAHDLATIRQAAARDAINAIALAEVVAALTARGDPDPVPDHRRWDAPAVPLAGVRSGGSYVLGHDAGPDVPG